MKMKKIISLLCIFIIACTSFAFAEETSIPQLIAPLMGNAEVVAPPVGADERIIVQLDGVNLDFTDSQGNVVNPQLINDRTMVPMRKIFEALGAEVEWDSVTRTVKAKTAEKEIALTIDDAHPSVKLLATGEVKTMTLDSVPVIRDGRTLVPVRFIAESLDKEVGWDGANRTVIIIDYAKFAEKLAKDVPGLKDLFALNINDMDSFKSTSTINGNLIYSDAKNATNNEEVKVDGTFSLSYDKKAQAEIAVDMKVDGQGDLVSELKAQGTGNLVAKIFYSADKFLLGMEQNGAMTWQDLSSTLQVSNAELGLLNRSELSISSYDDFIEAVKGFVGDLNANSYQELTTLFNALAKALGGDNLKLTEVDGVKTLSIKMDLDEVLVGLLPTDFGEIADVKIEAKVSAKDGYLVSDETKASFKLNTETGEKFDVSLNCTSVYSDINGDFTLTAPAV